MEKIKDDPTLWVKSPFPDIKPVIGVEVHEMIFERISHYGNLPALTCAISGKCLTYDQLYDQARALGAALLQRGVEKGDIAVIILPNCVEYPVAVLGCWSAGMKLVTLNPRLTESEILHQLQLCGDIRMVITDAASLGVLANAKNTSILIPTIVLVEEGVTPDFQSFPEMLKTPFEGVTFSSGKGIDTSTSPAWMAFSSGTTGPPKLAMLSHTQYTQSILQTFHEDIVTPDPIRQNRATNQQERFIALFPLFHVAGFTIYNLLALYQGAHTVMVPRFEPALFLQVIRSHKPTTLHLVTPVISHIVNSAEFTSDELASVHTVLASGAPIGKVLINKIIEKAEHYVFFLEVYAMTEFIYVTFLDRGTGNTKVGSSGRAAPSLTVKIVDVNTGETVGANKSGEICVKGPVAPLGYCRNEKAIKELVDADGWLHTGDVAYYDEDGYFYLVDRIKELIKVNAFPVAPSELEDLLRKHPKVADCAVIGIPSEKHGEVPRAFIVPKSKDVNEAEIQAYMSPLVATYKQLKGGVEFVETIAKTPSGKILRRNLRDEYARNRSKLDAS